MICHRWSAPDDVGLVRYRWVGRDLMPFAPRNFCATELLSERSWRLGLQHQSPGADRAIMHIGLDRRA